MLYNSGGQEVREKNYRKAHLSSKKEYVRYKKNTSKQNIIYKILRLFVLCLTKKVKQKNKSPPSRMW